MVKKYVVPEGMITAVVGAQNANRTLHDVVPNRNHIERDLEAAIRWLAENPIVPNDEQADKLWRHPKVLSSDEHYAKAQARDWQRQMFLAPQPDLPEEIKKAICEGVIPSEVPRVRKDYDAALTNAFELGQQTSHDMHMS